MVIILLDTSTPICKLSLIEDDKKSSYEWQSDRLLAKGLLSFIEAKLKGISKTWLDITAIGVFEGPGSFTGIRIGLTVMNTISSSQNIPIVGGRGDDWQNIVMTKLKNSINEKIALPFYGSDASITTLPK